jgi:predicted RNA binding protein YcfA (HicA-like mRNA interferase family)
MSKLPRVSGQQVVAALERLGFRVRRQHGSHITMRRDNPFAQAVVPAHRELDRGTIAGHSAADQHRGGGLHSIALSGRANAYAFLAVLSAPPLLPSSPPCQPCLILSGTDPFTDPGVRFARTGLLKLTRCVSPAGRFASVDPSFLRHLVACACFVSLFVPSPASRLASCHGLLWTNPTPCLASGRSSCR